MPDHVDGIRYLTTYDLELINQRIIEETSPEEPSGVLRFNDLSSAQQRPAHTRWYGQTEDLYLLGASLYCGLIWNHPFHNANKRTAFAACRMFLMLNGAYLNPPPEEAVDIALDSVQRLIDETHVASWLAMRSAPQDPSSADWSQLLTTPC